MNFCKCCTTNRTNTLQLNPNKVQGISKGLLMNSSPYCSVSTRIRLDMKVLHWSLYCTAGSWWHSNTAQPITHSIRCMLKGHWKRHHCQTWPPKVCTTEPTNRNLQDMSHGLSASYRLITNDMEVHTKFLPNQRPKSNEVASLSAFPC